MKRFQIPTFFAVVLLIASFFSSCGSQLVANQNSISIDSATMIYQDVALSNPVYVSPVSQSGQNSIVGIKEFSGITSDYIVSKIMNVNGNWQISLTDTLSNEYRYVNLIVPPSLEMIEDKNFVFIQTKENEGGTAAAGLGMVRFYLIDATNFSKYILTYAGEEMSDSLIKGEYSYSANLESKIAVKTFLDRKAASSSWIYHNEAADYELSNPKNFEKKFFIDNPNIKNNLSLYQSLKSTYYSENLVTYVRNNYFQRAETQFIVSDSTSNSKYIIYTLWRYGAIALDRSSKKYFPLIVYPCKDGCGDLFVRFVKNNVVEFGYSNYGVPTTIDIDQIVFK
jgi:hypothetical protein